jgi:hypothetical protein
LFVKENKKTNVFDGWKSELGFRRFVSGGTESPAAESESLG